MPPGCPRDGRQGVVARRADGDDYAVRLQTQPRQRGRRAEPKRTKRPPPAAEPPSSEPSCRRRRVTRNRLRTAPDATPAPPFRLGVAGALDGLRRHHRAVAGRAEAQSGEPSGGQPRRPRSGDRPPRPSMKPADDDLPVGAARASSPPRSRGRVDAGCRRGRSAVSSAPSGSSRVTTIVGCEGAAPPTIFPSGWMATPSRSRSRPAVVVTRACRSCRSPCRASRRGSAGRSRRSRRSAGGDDDDLAVGLKQRPIASPISKPPKSHEQAARRRRRGRPSRRGLDAPHRDVSVRRPKLRRPSRPRRSSRPAGRPVAPAYPMLSIVRVPPSRSRGSRGPGRRGRASGRDARSARAEAARPRWERGRAPEPPRRMFCSERRRKASPLAEARPDEEPLAGAEHHARIATEADDPAPQAQAHARRRAGRRRRSGRRAAASGPRDVRAPRRSDVGRPPAVAAVAPRLAVADRDVVAALPAICPLRSRAGRATAEENER